MAQSLTPQDLIDALEKLKQMALEQPVVRPFSVAVSARAYDEIADLAAKRGVSIEHAYWIWLGIME